MTRDAMPDEDRSRLHFALGKAYEDTGRFEEAFRQYREGNRLKRLLVPYESEHVRQQMSALRSFFTQEKINELADRIGCSSELPIFVVGMPRAGTTLVEQILASHPSVYGAGELPNVEKLITRLPGLSSPRTGFPHCLDSLSRDQITELTGQHIEYLSSLAPEAGRVVDKMPKNAFYVGLIRALWPDARIVLCNRDPLDVAMSCYTRYFARGQPFSWDLTELGTYCREHERLMGHWRSVVDRNFFQFNYERLVESQEEVTRQLIDFVGLPWHDQCLAFHETDRRIKTNPLAVRQPVYSSSIGRWKRFEPWIGELHDSLGTH